MFEPLVIGLCFPFVKHRPWQIRRAPKPLGMARQVHTTTAHVRTTERVLGASPDAIKAKKTAARISTNPKVNGPATKQWNMQTNIVRCLHKVPQRMNDSQANSIPEVLTQTHMNVSNTETEIPAWFDLIDASVMNTAEDPAVKMHEDQAMVMTQPSTNAHSQKNAHHWMQDVTILNDQSSVSSCLNPDLVQNIHAVNETPQMHSNARMV